MNKVSHGSPFICFSHSFTRAFAAVGALEAAVTIISQGNDSVALSKLYTITGTDQFYKPASNASNCSGGSSWDALLFATYHGLETEMQLPYEPICPASLPLESYEDTFAGIKSLREPVAVYAPYGDYQNASLARLAIQPVTIYTRVGISSLFLYSEGLFTEQDNCTEGIDQAMLLVGYNSTEKSYKAKNSWGTGWGEQGYIRFAMNNNTYGYTVIHTWCLLIL